MRTRAARIQRRLRGRAGLLGALAMLLTGCTVGPDYQPTKMDTPTGWDGTTLAAAGQTSVATADAAAEN